MRGYRMLCLGAVPLLAACVNPYAQNYVDRTGGVDISKESGVVVSKAIPQVVRGGTDPDADYQTMFGEGFRMLGYSSFNGRAAAEYLARQQAEAVKAERVLVYYKVTGSTQTLEPVSSSESVSTTTDYSGSHVGRGTATTTVTQTKTKMVPVVVPLYDQFATFWIRSKAAPIFGVDVRDLTSEQRTSLQSNKGVNVFAIQKRSPAYEADFLNGDIVKAIGGSEVSDTQGFQDLLFRYAGQRVNIKFVRGGQTLSKEVQLNPQQP